jgi:hypothetical protein
MHEMLHPMHRYRRCRVGDIEDALHPQQRIAMAVKPRISVLTGTKSISVANPQAGTSLQSR